MKNPFGKRRDINNPYAVYVDSYDFEYRVLKTNQRRDKEHDNPLASWHVATKSPLTFGSYEYGDGYVSDILSNNAGLVDATDEWKDVYGN